MNFRKRTLAIGCSVVVLLSMMASTAIAQTTNDGVLVNPNYDCTDFAQTFGFTSATDKSFTLSGDRTTATTADGAFGVTVDTNCNFAPWALNVSSEDFTADDFGGEEFDFPTPPSISASKLALTPSGSVSVVFEPRMLANLFFIGIDPNDSAQVATLVNSHLPQAHTVTDLTSAKTILDSSFANPALETVGAGVPSPVGMQGVTTASFTGSFSDLPILAKGAEYRGTLTLTFVSNAP